MLRHAVTGLKTICTALFVIAVAAAAPAQAQPDTLPEKKGPVLSPEIRKSLDSALDHLKSQLDAHEKKMTTIEDRLFASPARILELCRSPMRPQTYRPVLNHFRATTGDPVSLPAVDCLFMKTEDGGARLWTYKAASDNSYYMLRAHEGMTPEGAFVFARHPLNFIHRRVLNGPDWVIRRSTFAPLGAFPLTANATLTLSENGDGEDPAAVTAKVVKSFPIVHHLDGQPTTVETLHVVVKDLGQRHLLGKMRDSRRWYIYSQMANVFVERSHALTQLDSEKKAATGINGALSSLSYIKDGKYVLTLSTADLAPLRDFVATFDVWATD